MRILDRYIVREVFSSCAPGPRCLHLCLFRSATRSPYGIARYAIQVPAGNWSTFPLLFPASDVYRADAILVGVLLGLGRMSADSEIIALTAPGDWP